MTTEPTDGGILEIAPAPIEKTDPVVRQIEKSIAAEITADAIEIPRLPDLASRILQLAQDPDVSTEEVIRHIRMDPVLSGRLLKMANSAAFAGSEHVYSLQMAVVRLGLNRVAETVFELSVNLKAFRKEKRSHILRRLWKFTVATGFACEELARRAGARKPEEAFLTGIFHAVGSPAIVNAIGKLERTGAIPPQGEGRVFGLIERLSIGITGKIVRNWKLPKTAQEAIGLQDEKVRKRRGKPLAHLLVCAKDIATELGLGTRPEPIDFARCRDFKFVEIHDTEALDPVRAAVVDRMEQVLKD